MSHTVMFIHGAWLTSAAWEPFQHRFEAQGFATLAPAWPHEEELSIEELRNSQDPQLGKLTIKRIVDHYEKKIRALPEPPILVGHSYGGLFVQKLLDRGLGVCGVALDPVAIRGVLPSLQALRSAFPALAHWNGWNRVVTMTFEDFADTFAQTLPEEEKRAAYEKFVVGVPGRIYYQAALSIGNGVDVKNPNRAPLLLVAGESDRTITESMVRATYLKQSKNPSITAFKAFPARSHFLMLEPGYEEIADYIIAWVKNPVPVAPVAKAA